MAFIFVLKGELSCTLKINGQLISIENRTLAVLAPPEVEISNRTMTVYEKTTFDLTCEAKVHGTGYPNASNGVMFKWLKDNQEIRDGDGKFHL